MVSDTMNYPIQLIKKEPSKFVALKKFNANEGVIIEVNGATVTIPESSLEKSDGSDYNGTVDISVVYLSPTESPAMEPLMPGADLMAIANDGDTVPLISYGMVNVEMSDEDGNPLQLKDGCEAYLKYPAPKGFTSHDTIPLWYFNEESGLWVEEGYTTRQGEEYVGSVRHFTWWNCDIKLENGARLRCRLINYPYHSVCICSAPDTISTSVVNETCTSNIFPNRPFSIAGVKMRSLKPGEFLDTTICVNRFVFQDINGNTLKSVKFKINDVLYYSNGENPIIVPIDKNEETTIRFQKYETKTITKDDFNSENVCVIVCKPLEKKNTSPSLISNVATESNKGSAQNATTKVNNEIDEEWDNNDTTVYEGSRLEINPSLENQSYYTSFLRKNIKYPTTCMETGIQGRVFVEFIIEKDGSVSNVRVVNSVQLKVGSNQKVDNKSKDFELLEQEAVRVVKLFKGLQPGIKNGNIVRTKHLIPVTFKLN
jgi:outer membrane biosynthesis protein TonB